MAKAKSAPKKKSRFVAGLVVYAWMLLILGAAAIFILFTYLQNYESLQPKHVLERYRSALETQLPAAAAESLGDLDGAVVPSEQALAYVRERMEGASLAKDGSQTNAQRMVYRVLDGEGQPVGSVRFEVTDEGPFHIPVWTVTEERFDFSSYYETMQVTVPAGWSVYLGEKLLGPENVVEDQIPFETLSACYAHYEGLPTLVRYEVGPFLGSPALRIVDPNGAEHVREDLTEEAILDNCPAEARARVEQFLPEFIRLYVYYSADMDHSAMAYYNDLTHLVVPDSELWQVVTQAVGSFGYTNTRALTLSPIQIQGVTDLGQGRYLATLSYDLEITGLYRTSSTHDTVQLVLLEQDGKLLADALYYV